MNDPVNPPPAAPLPETYWAAEGSEKLGEHLRRLVVEAGTDTLLTGINASHAQSFSVYYGQNASGVHATSQVLRGGDVGELAEIKVNHSRPLVNTLLNLIVAPKITWTPKAVSIDYDSLREIELAKAVLEYYFHETRVSALATLCLEDALVFRDGFLLLGWDAQAGDDAAPDIDSQGNPTGALLKTGDVKLTRIPTWDVIRSSTKGSWESLDWVVVRTYQNKFDLVATYDPDGSQAIAERILAVGTDLRLSASSPTLKALTDSDDIAVYTFFHKRRPSMPDGREVVFLENQTVLHDSPLSWDSIPLYRVAAAEMVGTAYGYTPFLDIQGVQEVSDAINSSITTNQTALATQNIAVEQGTEFNVEELGGMKITLYPQGGKAPEALQLCRSPPESFSYLKELERQQALLIGLNSVVRGEPQSGDQSGSALVHLSSQALQQASTILSNYLSFVQQIGNGLFEAIKRNLSAEKKVALVGRGNSYLVDDASYSKDSFNRIKRVTVEIGNPMAQTTAGREIIAKDLLQGQFIQSAEQYLEVLATGKLEPLTQSLTNELLLIRSENEGLARGEPQPVLVLDDHKMHAREHRALLANPQARRNPQVVQAVLEHITEHEQLWMQAPPLTLMMVGQEPPPMPMGPMPGDAGGENPKGSQPAPPMPSGNPNVGKAPKQPSQPTNPATGQKFNPVDGGGAVPR